MTAEEIAKSVKTLYSLPALVMRLNDALNDPYASSADLERIIINDPGLTVKILKFTNSSYFGFAHKIDSLSQAISLIGQQELRNLVMLNAVCSTFKGIPEHLVDMQSFWLNSITCGVLCRCLAKQGRQPNQERYFILGLLRNIGKLVLLSEFPTRYCQILNQGKLDEPSILAAEQAEFGFTHPLLTAEILKLWQLPANIWQVIQYQYQPLAAPDYHKDIYILHIAALLTDVTEPYTKTDPDIEQLQQIIENPEYNILDLEIGTFQQVIVESSMQTLEILNIIMPGAGLIF